MKSALRHRRRPSGQSSFESHSGSIDGNMRIGTSSIYKHNSRATKHYAYAAQAVTLYLTSIYAGQFHLDCNDASRCVTECRTETSVDVKSKFVRDVVSGDVHVHASRHRNL
jgi:hypothetical protein